MFYDTHRRWTAKEEKFLNDNAGTLSLEQLAKELKKTVTAVKLYMHRKRISPAAEKVTRNLVRELLIVKFTNPDYFTPTRDFYTAVGMSQKRWWEVYYGRKMLSDEEYQNLAGHFNVTLEGVAESKQLNLFEDGDSDGSN